MKKITVKHYLYKRIKPDFNENNEPVFPVYVKVICNRKSTNFRSEIITKRRITETEFNNDAQIKQERELEVFLTTYVVSLGMELLGDKFNFLNLVTSILKLQYPIYSFIHTEMFDNKKIRLALIEFMCNKTGLDELIIADIIGCYVDLRIDTIVQLSKKSIIDSRYYSFGLFYNLLRDFSCERYGNSENVWGGASSLSWYEWEVRGVKHDFINYVLLSEKMVKDELMILVNKLDIMILSDIKKYLTFPCGIESTKSRN